MKRSTAVLGLCAGLALLALPLIAQRPAPQAAQDASTPVEEGPLVLAMDGLQGGMRALGRAIADPAGYPALLPTLREMQGHALVAFQHAPPAPEGEDAAAFGLGFRREVHTLLGELLDLEVALSKGDGEAARKAFAALNARKKAGHDRFKLGR